MKPMFEKTIAMPLAYEMLVRRHVAAEPAARRPLWRGPRVPRRRRRASRDPDRRARHEQRRRRRHRPVVEARRRRSPAGAVRSCCRPTRPSGGRSARNNVAASRHATVGRRKWRGAYTPLIRENTPEGLAARAAFAQLADVEQRKASDMIGAELGYRYVGSPLIAAEPGEGPEYKFMEYVPTTWPGARLPHVWLDDGTAMQDRIGYGHGYTLLRLGGTRVGGECACTGLRDARCAAAGARRSGRRAARHLRLRPAAAAARHARGLARQRDAPRSREARRDGDRALSQSHHEAGCACAPLGRSYHEHDRAGGLARLDIGMRARRVAQRVFLADLDPDLAARNHREHVIGGRN